MRLNITFLRIVLLFSLLTLNSITIQAQQQHKSSRQPQRFEETQGRNFENYLHTKCELVIRELGLSTFDSAHFEPLYHQLQKEKMELFRKYGSARKVRKALDEGKQIPDSTLMRVLNNNAKLQVEDALLEQTFLNKFARVLTPKQLFKLQQAEQKYRKDVIRQGHPAKK